jgi:hypothetical protein
MTRGMQALMDKAKREHFTDAEKQELQRLFCLVAENDARVLDDMTDSEGDQ